jgi:hypothetical protein
MSSLLAAPLASLESDPELAKNVVHALRSSGFDRAISRLDPFHPDLSVSDRYEIFKARYEEKLITDGLETGHFVLNGKGEIAVAISQPLPSIAGFIFEAFTVRTFNERKDSVGKKAFLWSTEKSRVKADFLEQFHAVGTGFPSTSSRFPQLYNPTLRQFDVIFYRMNPHQNMPEPAVVKRTTNPAGIQIKAITTNEKSEIIDPLLQGKYRRVVTYLRHPDDRLSYEACMDLSRSLYRSQQIDREQLHFLEEAVVSPEMLGIDQREVDAYYRYVQAWYRRQAAQDEIILHGLGIRINEKKYNGSLITTISA